MKKLLSLFLVLALAFSLCVGVLADETTAAEPSDETAGELAGQIVILHTNDVHGAIDGYAKVAALKADYEAKGAEVLLVDAGDFIQGTTSVSVSQGATAVELMNLAGYDLVTLGNHEFDYGMDNLKTIFAKAEFGVVAANIKLNGAAAFDDLKRTVMGREVVCAITEGRLDFGTWEQIFYFEFDGMRPKHALIKIIGE